jgi:prepilin-type N-terminal cleavage/methylation domain-containing protein
MHRSDLVTTRACDEDGFTLIELLVTIVIMGVIIVPLGTAFNTFLQNTDTTIRRVGESHDAQVSAAYFAQDAASIGDRDSSDALIQSVEKGTTSQFTACGPVVPVVGFAWEDYTSPTASSQVRAVYVVRTVGTERQLHRLVCLGSSTTPSVDLVVIHNLDSSAPQVTCSSADCAGIGSSVPQWVKLALSIKNPASPGTPLSVTLFGQRRQT